MERRKETEEERKRKEGLLMPEQHRPFAAFLCCHLVVISIHYRYGPTHSTRTQK